MTTVLDTMRFAAIDEESTDLVIIDREPAYATPLRSCQLAAGRYQDTVTPSNARAVAIASCATLGLTVPGLATDIAELAECFLSSLRRPAASLRLDVVHDLSCPKLHIDSVHVRLITTYLGAGTEYCDAATPQVIRSVPEGSIALLKGRRHATHGGAILHRSPATTASTPRVVLVLDY